MKYTILFIVSCYIGRTEEYIAPEGVPKDDSTENMQSSTQANLMNITESELLQKNDTSLNYLINALEKDIYSVSQPKSSEINQRAFIYMNSVRPIHNKLYLSQTRNDPKNSGHTIHEDKLYEDFLEKLLAKQRNKDCHIQEEPNINIQYKTNFESYIKKAAAEARLKDSLGKRNFLELLKTPLIRLVSKNKIEKKRCSKLKNMDTKEVDKDLSDQQNGSKNEDLISTEVERLVDQFMSTFLGRPVQTFPNKGNTISNTQESHKSTCKCKIGSDSETTFYSIDDVI